MHEALDMLCTFVTGTELSDGTATRFYRFQKNLLQDIEKQKVQCKVTGYFEALKQKPVLCQVCIIRDLLEPALHNAFSENTV